MPSESAAAGRYAGPTYRATRTARVRTPSRFAKAQCTCKATAVASSAWHPRENSSIDVKIAWTMSSAHFVNMIYQPFHHWL